MSPPEQKRLFHHILKGVSRSFFLSLRVLPVTLREPVALAYLLARAADTMADTTVLSSEQRLMHLQQFKRYVAAPESAIDGADILAELQCRLDNADEQHLLMLLPQLFSLLALQSGQDLALIQQVVGALTDGMVFDLKHFPNEESGELKALPQQTDLDRYTYMVAGSVGEFWTEISFAHSNALSRIDKQQLTALGVRFGKGLQMTNILRDLPRDLRIGRCYLPQAWLARQQLSVEQLLDKTNSDLAKPLLEQGIVLALQHFEAAADYVLAMPRRCVRLRLAALWPLMIGLATLGKLSVSDTWLDAGATIKVERTWVYGMIVKSLCLVGSNAALRRWFDAERKSLH